MKNKLGRRLHLVFFRAVAEVPSLEGTEDFFVVVASDSMSYVYVLKDDVEEPSPDELADIYGEPNGDC
jgi:hypothetical protein